MLEAFINGAFAGYAIAIPVGAIAVLILETGLQRGFWHGFAAGSGAATADLIYASLAATIGSLVAVVLAPIATALKFLSAAFLVALGAWGLGKAWRARTSTNEMLVEAPRANMIRTYATFLGLTVLNPATVAYFAALILGLNANARPTSGERVLFVAGVFMSSWSWQSLLAASGALAHRHLPASFRQITSVVGNCIIIALGIKILF